MKSPSAEAFKGSSTHHSIGTWYPSIASHPFIRTDSHKSMFSPNTTPSDLLVNTSDSTVATASDHSTMTSSSHTGTSHLLPFSKVHRVNFVHYKAPCLSWGVFLIIRSTPYHRKDHSSSGVPLIYHRRDFFL